MAHAAHRQKARTGATGVPQKGNALRRVHRRIQRTLLDAITHSLDKPETLLKAYALLNRIRLCASPAVLAEAEHLVRASPATFSSSNLSLLDEMRPRTLEDADPLKSFGEACREEFASLSARL